jgi:hypothetical protein
MVNGSGGDMLLLVLPDMPTELKDPLVRQLQLTFNERMTFTDSHKEGEDFHFETYHFTHYNRYSARVRHQLLSEARTYFHDLSRVTNVLQHRTLQLTKKTLRKRRSTLVSFFLELAPTSKITWTAIV